jgi:hypothetical protein
MTRAFLEQRLRVIRAQLATLPATSTRRADLIAEMREIQLRLNKNNV